MRRDSKNGPRQARQAALAFALALSVGGCADSASLARCSVPSVEQVIPTEGALFGVNPDWENQTLQEYAAAIGHRPAVAVSFADIPLNEADTDNVVAAGDQVAANGGALLLTLEPTSGLAAVTPQVAADVADVLASLEERGTAVIVRFAHEMNGSWYAWGQQPVEYVAAFRTMSEALREGTHSAAMMWAPNYGGGYPFAGGVSEAEPGTANFVALDTNSDGSLSMADDPYAAYYPGDDVVDWVGMSLYHWGSVHPWGENEMPEPQKFAQQLTGQYNGLNGDDTDVPDFYTDYGVDRGKPVAIPETAALVVRRGDTAGELAIKQAWWQQIFADETLEQFPDLRMINWFEWDKFEPEVGADVDWALTSDQTTNDLFKADLPSWAQFASPPPACTPAISTR
jgi:hypothetical protein